MTMPGHQPGQQPGFGQMAEKLLGWPEPQKFLFELQRLNTNIEVIHPDLHSLANSLETLKGADVRDLSAALHKINVNDLLRACNQFNLLAGEIYEKLWGKR